MTDASTQHEMTSALKDLAIELGYTPTKTEFTKQKGISERKVTQAFGSYTILVQAAGLEPYKGGTRPKITNAIFERPIEKHLADYVPREKVDRKPYPSMLIASDIHWPFQCQKAVEKFIRRCETKPDYIILNGDAFDMYAFSKFPRSLNVYSPKDEEQLAKKLNTEFWSEIKRRSPKSRCIQLLGNHDMRGLKRVIEAVPSMEHWAEKYMADLFRFDGVETIMDPRQELVIDDIMIHHGFKSKLGDHRDHNLQSSISSHTHRPGVVWRTVRGSAMFELNTGYLGDPEAKGLTYTPTKTVDWVQAFGEVDEDGPRNVII